MCLGCSIADEIIPKGYQYGNFDKLNSNITQCLFDLCSVDGILCGEEIMNYCFPNTNTDVFISHSHNDLTAAKSLAGYLKDKFNLYSFIDSIVWENSKDLLKSIDNEYCFDNANETYNYQKRNLSTSYVYMMLAVSLMKVMANCRCFIFINSPNSLSMRNIKDNPQTFSPWLFYEMALFNEIEKIKKTRDITIAEESIQYFSLISLPAKNDNLKVIDKEILQNWEEKYSTFSAQEDALTILHHLFNIKK